jgi:hypothetical protein
VVGLGVLWGGAPSPNMVGYKGSRIGIKNFWSFDLNKIYCAMEFVCPKTWESFTVTARDDVRFCNHCSKKVYLCASQAEVDSAAELRKCVAFDSVHAFAHVDNLVDAVKTVVIKRTLGLPSIS